MADSYDAFDVLDTTKLEEVVTLLKAAGVSHFKCGAVEFSFEPAEEEEVHEMGFIPPAERAGEMARNAQPTGDPEDGVGYGRAFGGKPPRFKPATKG